MHNRCLCEDKKYERAHQSSLDVHLRVEVLYQQQSGQKLRPEMYDSAAWEEERRFIDSNASALEPVYYAKCHPQDFDLVIPAVPQGISTIMSNYPKKWKTAFSLVYSDANGHIIGSARERGYSIRGGSHMVEHWPSASIEWAMGEVAIGYESLPGSDIVFSAGPVLVEEGVARTAEEIDRDIERLGYEDLSVKAMTLRAALGYDREEGLLVHAYSSHSNLLRLARAMSELGCSSAMSLAGGDKMVVMAREDRHSVERAGDDSLPQPLAGLMKTLVQSGEIHPSQPGGDELPDVNYQLTANFLLGEFPCPHCSRVKLGKGFTELVSRPQVLRERAGEPVFITSAYRCPEYNRMVEGASNSQHLLGKAADIRLAYHTPEEVATIAEAVGFRGIGIYRTFTHVDVRDTPARWRG